MPKKGGLYLFDRDNLKEVFAGEKEKAQLKAAGFSTIKALSNALIAQNAQSAEYIIWLPGVGKTTYAKKIFGAKEITRRNIGKLLSLDMKNMVFVTSDVEDEIAQKAKQITLLHTSPHRVKQQREKRDEEIEEGTSETAFGRSARSTARVSTDASILISKLKTNYEEKSRVVMYTSWNTDNWDSTKEFPVNQLSDKRKYVEAGVVAASGKRSPVHIVHMKHQIKKIIIMAAELWLTWYLCIWDASGDEYDLGLTQKERMQIIDLEVQGELLYVLEGTPKFIKTKKGKIIKIIPEESFAIIGKERLPEGFVAGTYKEFIDKYPDFMKKQKNEKDLAYAVRKFAGYYLINMGNVLMEGSEKSVSATIVREYLVKGMLDELKPYLNPKIFEALTKEENLAVLQRRYPLIQERDALLKVKNEELEEKYLYHHPLTQKSLFTKDGKRKKLDMTVVNACKDLKDREKISKYLLSAKEKIKEAEKIIKKKYSVQIYSEENKLVF